eukprot:2466645-Prymnesium_polylepis.1
MVAPAATSSHLRRWRPHRRRMCSPQSCALGRAGRRGCARRSRAPHPRVTANQTGSGPRPRGTATCSAVEVCDAWEPFAAGATSPRRRPRACVVTDTTSTRPVAWGVLSSCGYVWDARELMHVRRVLCQAAACR